MDSRTTAANGRVAALDLAGKVAAERFVTGEAARIGQAVVDLCGAPGGARVRQLLFGASVTVYERRDGHAFVQTGLDGYVGYVSETVLAGDGAVTHRVGTRATHVYEAPDIKSATGLRLGFGAQIGVTAEGKRFFETPQGFIPKSHLRPLDKPFADPVTVAQLFFGAPYLWGGNSDLGIDCSGLVQAGLAACGFDCPGDSDQQRAALGRDLATDAAPRRGDLWFWNGHVGLVVDPETLLHANAHHMSVAYEPLDRARLRIDAQGDGPVLARKRL